MFIKTIMWLLRLELQGIPLRQIFFYYLIICNMYVLVGKIPDTQEINKIILIKLVI
jgi:hypothetical protein